MFIEQQSHSSFCIDPAAGAVVMVFQGKEKLDLLRVYR